MSFMDDMQERDLTLLQMLDGREVIYTPASGSPRAISAMFQEHHELLGGDTVDIVTTGPMLSVRSIDIQEIQAQDIFTIDGQDYEVAVIRPNNEGMTEVMLEKQP